MTARRADIAASLKQNNVFDVVVVGGGINGIGVYRDLALQGLRVLLVEKNDFCSGCSAAPSRMIHGGLRYLENGEFDLVKESLRERDSLLMGAPHMVRPLPTVIPITTLFSGLFNSAASFFGFQGKPSARGLLPISLGLSLYDWVTRKRRILPKHSISLGKKTRSKWPFLNSGVKYSATFYDAWISHPERLCLELLKDTEVESPKCLAVNHARFRTDGNDYSLQDEISGEVFEIKPRVIVNAAGAWVDQVAQDLKSEQQDKLVSGTKGSHLIIDNERLLKSLNGHMVYFENSDGRICIVFPYLGKVLAGSTDIRVDHAGRVRCEPEEFDYILESLSLVFQNIEIKPSEVVFSYSGIRPLPHSDQEFTGRISRGHFVKKIDGAIKQFCMVGGKWTTFRAFGEETADEVMKELGHPRIQSTLGLQIGGGKNFPGDPSELVYELQDHFGISNTRAWHLVDHYGSAAAEIHKACSNYANDAPLGEGSEYTSGEIAYLARNEFAEKISDVVMRRTSLAITGKLTPEILDAICDTVSVVWNVSQQTISQQRQSLVDELEKYHGVKAETLLSKKANRSTQCA